MATPFGHTADGFEMQFGTNHLGHFVFVNRIAALLRDGDHFHGLVIFLAQKFKGSTQHVRVERAAQAALSGRHQHEHAFFRALR